MGWLILKRSVRGVRIFSIGKNAISEWWLTPVGIVCYAFLRWQDLRGEAIVKVDLGLMYYKSKKQEARLDQ